MDSGLRHRPRNDSGEIGAKQAECDSSRKFDGEFARGSQTYAGTGTLRVSW
jgi:hypothetical protein